MNELLPYRNRIKELSGTVSEVTPIYNQMEKDWFNVAEGMWSEEEINENMYKYIGQWSEIEGQLLKDDSLPHKQSCIDKAEEEKNSYFERCFGG